MEFVEMTTNIIINYIILGILCNNCFGEGYFVVLSHNGPVVLGAIITFKAELYNDQGQSPTGTFLFRWKDNAIPPHYEEIEGHATVSYWNVSFSKDLYAPGPYEAEVDVYRHNFFLWPVSSQRIIFNITALLNGNMLLIQSNRERNGEFVSSTEQVSHQVALLPADSYYLSTAATSVLSYWFIDCIYYGQTPGLAFNFNYTDPGNTHHVEALVIASYEPPTTTTTTTITTTEATTTTTPSTTPTSTTTPTTTHTSSSTSSTPTTHTPSSHSSSSPSPHNVTGLTPLTSTISPTFTNSTSIVSLPKNHSLQISSNEIENILKMFPLTENVTALPVLSPAITIRNTSVNINSNLSSIGLPYICLNSSLIPPDPRKTYGYFHRKIFVKAPVVNVTVNGNNWLQHGDMLNLQVSCRGSSSFGHCFMIVSGIKNATGNETCPETKPNVDCQFEVVHYFREPAEYTVFIIINNDVSKVVTAVGINVYKVTKHAQLSVIVVPVSCSVVAVILIVFGVAYYVQSKNRYTIEVADFDFGQANDMEYKTFKERLKESMVNAVNRSDFADAGGSTWSPSRKYGQMGQD